MYVTSTPGAQAVFQGLPAPNPDDLQEISRRVYLRTRELLRGHGYDWEQPEQSEAQEPLAGTLEQQELLDCAQASLLDVALLGPAAGQPLLPRDRMQRLHLPADLDPRRGARLVTGGFDLQATRRVSAHDLAGRERMMRYLLHPPLSHDRLSWTDDGRVRLRFSRPWRDGTASIVMDPLTFIGRLVPMVPLPGSHQLRYFGVLAPRAALRPRVVRPRARPRQLVMFDRTGTATNRRPRLC